MLFNSFPFIIFFIVVTTLFYVLKHQYRWILLLIASCIFYSFFKWEYIFILLGTIIIDYYAGIKIECANSNSKKRNYLILSLIANIGVLMVFKYYNFVNENVSSLGNLLGFKNYLPSLNIILPIGLSFHTFQAMSYTIEVYRGKQKAEKHFGIYSLYVMFYPQLVAGPIERPQNIISQFHQPVKFNYQNVTDGLKLIGWGLFKKIVIADRVCEYVNVLYQDPTSFHGLQALIPVCLFSYQIYCDFSGYSDIALGTAKVMGYDLMVNFNNPYYSKSISEFWTRWHISLSTWFKDYLYIPLGGNKTTKIKWARNILIVFMLSGLWHGASWNFIIWGAIHGSILIITTLLLKKLKINESKLFQLISIVATFTIVSFAWIFFRGETFSTSITIIKNIPVGLSTDLISLATNTKSALHHLIYLNKGQDAFIISFTSIIILESIQYIKRNKPNFYFFQDKKTSIRWLFYISLTLWIALFGVYQSNNEFIYFQF